MRKNSFAEQVFGIGRYTYINGHLYFVHGKNRIKVTEHFPTGGKQISELQEDLIRYASEHQDNAA